jgi:GNAT superfamily N-acetyltransferase
VSAAHIVGETAPQAWARCRPWLEAALERAGGTHGIDDVARLVERGDAHFWPAAACAVVTEFYFYPRLKACNFWLLGGNLKALLALQPVIETWARAQGCTRMLGGGPRAGWTRVLAPRGYRPAWTIYCKELRP